MGTSGSESVLDASGCLRDWGAGGRGGEGGGGGGEVNPFKAWWKICCLILFSALLAQALLGVPLSKQLLVTSDKMEFSPRKRLFAIPDYVHAVRARGVNDA